MVRQRQGFMKRFFTSLFVSAVISCNCIFLYLVILALRGMNLCISNNANVTVSWFKHPYFKKLINIFYADVTDFHPPLRKLVAGITHEIFTNTLHIIDTTRAIAYLLFYLYFPSRLFLRILQSGQFGYVIGILVPFVFSLLPMYFFLTPLLTLDYAIASLWFMAVMFALKGMKNYLWLILSAVCVGCAMLTKLHG